MSIREATAVGRVFSQLSRPQNILYSGLLAAVSSYAFVLSVGVAIYLYVTVLLLYAVAAALNNFYDVATDKLNKRTENPLINQTLNKQQLTIFFIACGIGIFALQFVLKQPASLIATAVYIGLLICYSHPRIAIQRKGFAATILLGLCYGVIPLNLGLLQADVWAWSHVVQLSLLQLLLLAPMLLAKDYKDEHGDKLTGKLTPLIRYGRRTVHASAAVFTLLAMAMYVKLAHDAHVSVYEQLLLGSLYSLLIVVLHVKKGRLPKQIQLLLTAVLLALSLRVLS